MTQRGHVYCELSERLWVRGDRLPILGLVPCFFAHGRQEYITIVKVSHHVDKPLFSICSVPFQGMFYVHMEIPSFGWKQGWEREASIMAHFCTLTFEPYELLKYENKYKGYASGGGKVVPDGSLDIQEGNKSNRKRNAGKYK
jgi:hypothetical protein